MDLAGLKPLVGQQCIAVTGSQKFVGTFALIANSTSSIAMEPLIASLAAQYDFAINGVAALDIGSITFCQRLADYGGA